MDDAFITQFENLSLDPIQFNHIGHLRLCWLYLKQNELQTAIGKTCEGIQSYATSQNATDKFHRTITEFLVRLIHSRINLQSDGSFEAFLDHNKDLVNNAQSILNQFYSPSLLNSAAARINYLQPDLQRLAS